MARELIFPSKNVTLGQLTEKQRLFVQHYVELGGTNASEAARRAGYPERSARARASENLRNSNVLAVLRDELTNKLGAGAAIGVTTLIDLAQNAESEATRLAAANSLIDRGYGPVASRNLNLNANVTTVEDKLRELAAKSEGSEFDDSEIPITDFSDEFPEDTLNQPRNRKSPVIDAEASEIEDDEER